MAPTRGSAAISATVSARASTTMTSEVQPQRVGSSPRRSREAAKVSAAVTPATPTTTVASVARTGRRPGPRPRPRASETPALVVTPPTRPGRGPRAERTPIPVLAVARPARQAARAASPSAAAATTPAPTAAPATFGAQPGLRLEVAERAEGLDGSGRQSAAEGDDRGDRRGDRRREHAGQAPLGRGHAQGRLDLLVGGVGLEPATERLPDEQQAHQRRHGGTGQQPSDQHLGGGRGGVAPLVRGRQGHAGELLGPFADRVGGGQVGHRRRHRRQPGVPVGEPQIDGGAGPVPSP